MRAPWRRWLTAVGAALALLAAGPTAAAKGPLPVRAGALGRPAPGRGGRPRGSDAVGGALPPAASRRLLADDVAGTYTLIKRSNELSGACPAGLTLDRTQLMGSAKPHDLLRYPGDGITVDGTRCEGDGLAVIRTFALYDPKYMARHGLPDAISRLNGTKTMRAYLQWSDSVGVSINSWTCGNLHQPDNVMLFGDTALRPSLWVNGKPEKQVLEDGHPHMLIFNKHHVQCLLKRPVPPTASPTPAADASAPRTGSQGSGRGSGLSAGPVAGVAVGAAVVAVAAAGAVAFGYRRWATRRGTGKGRGSLGLAPSLPSGLLYTWEEMTPSGSDMSSGGT
ncbi:hypothetical protein I4F81_008175 [Pyropia yezoensis]|uniref:Uncharacterized protein n=1 Tax=Pyropia yezoensis TaxID=2788 RepID=A0ACC3C6N6_PYRYE|nr:hypothetical protein I4F81_008175 [Neopyropia yezoensis]